MKIIAIVSSLISREAYEAEWLSPVNHRLADLALSTSRMLCPVQEVSLRITETRNKLHAFRSFRSPESFSREAHRQNFSWGRCLIESKRNDAFTSVWLLEGWSNRIADEYWQTNSNAPSLKDSESTHDPTGRFNLPLHTGAGLSFARRVIARCLASPGTTRIREAADSFVQLALERAVPQYFDCILEALGLVVRNLYPQFIESFSSAMAANSLDAFALFWHGVGRGLYFDPIHLIPGVPMRRWSLDEAVSSAPGNCARANVLSGFFWALTLVNIRHPEVVTSFLGSRPVEQWKRNAAAVSDGVSAALLVWHHLTGDTAITEHFLCHVPSRAHETLRPFWGDQIVALSRRRLTYEYETLRRDDRIADIFRFQER